MKEVKSPKKPLIFYYGIALLVIVLFNVIVSPLLVKARVTEVDYGTFMSMIEQKKIGNVEVDDDQIIFTDKDDAKKIYKTGAMNDPTLTQRLYDSGAKFSKDIETTTSPLVSFLLTFVLPLIIFIGLGQYMGKKLMEQAGGKNSMAFGFGKSNAKVYVPSTQGIHFSDVAGEDEAKESLSEIVDYLHNPKKYSDVGASMPKGVLLVGPPGTGKTMLAQRMPSILPDLSFDEALEVTKIHSIAGLLPKDQPLILNRPFRSPHHTISSAGLSGGGSTPKPGELSLAHNGILFLDELPEFRRDSLEVLRQPLEDGNVTISRVNATLTYPCNIMLIASMNPCKCGYFGDSRRQCTCTPTQVNRYRSRISGPLLDRIDIQVEVSNVDYEDLSSTENSETSAEIKKRVNKTRKLQLERYKDYNIYSNSQLDAGMLKKFCPLGEEENAILRAAFDNLGLSARAHSRILKVARTIADLEGSENIKSEHIAEAIQYRSLDRKYFE